MKVKLKHKSFPRVLSNFLIYQEWINSAVKSPACLSTPLESGCGLPSCRHRWDEIVCICVDCVSSLCCVHNLATWITSNKHTKCMHPCMMIIYNKGWGKFPRRNSKAQWRWQGYFEMIGDCREELECWQVCTWNMMQFLLYLWLECMIHLFGAWKLSESQTLCVYWLAHAKTVVQCLVWLELAHQGMSSAFRLRMRISDTCVTFKNLFTL